MSSRGWATTTLGQVLPLAYGKGLPKKTRAIGAVPVYGSSGVVGNHSTALTSGPTLIVGRKGNVGEAHLSMVPCWPIDTVYFTEGGSGVDLRFFYHLLRFRDLKHLDRSTAVPGLSREDYNQVEIDLPPQPEQERIVDAIDSYLTRLDAAVESLERVQAKLKAYRASVLQAAVEGRLVPTEASLARAEERDYEPADVLLARILKERRRRWEEAEFARLKAAGKMPTDDKWKVKYEEPMAPDESTLPLLPEGWCWARFDQLTSLVTSGSRGWAHYYSDDGATFVRAQDIKTDALVFESIAHVSPPKGAEGARTLVRQFDLLVTITGANVTKTALVELPLGEAYVSQHIGLCRPVLSETAGYLHLFVVCPAAGRRYLEKVAYGAGKPGLNLDNLKDMVVALPPSAEATRLVEQSASLLSVAAKIEDTVSSELLRVNRLRQATLKWAFGGKLVDQDPNDEPAEKLLARIRAERSATTPSKKSHLSPVKGAA